MGQGVGPRDRAGRQVLAQVGPGLQRGGEAFGDRSDVEQHRFATLAHGEPAKARGIHARRTEQLGGGAQIVQVVRVLAQTQGNANFFVRNGRVVRRERRIEVTLVMGCAPFHRDLEQPLRKAISCPGQARQADGQARHVGGVAQPAGQRSRRRLFFRFHREQHIRTRIILQQRKCAGELLMGLSNHSANRSFRPSSHGRSAGARTTLFKGGVAFTPAVAFTKTKCHAAGVVTAVLPIALDLGFCCRYAAA